jgi:hypothetical protein
MEILINKFLKYWKNYQDSWSEEYLKIYEKFSFMQNNCENHDINYENNLHNLLKNDMHEFYGSEEDEEYIEKNKYNANNKTDKNNMEKYGNLLFENGNLLKNPMSNTPSVNIRKENKKIFHIKRSRNTIAIGSNKFESDQNIFNSGYLDKERNDNDNTNNNNINNENKDKDKDDNFDKYKYKYKKENNVILESNEDSEEKDTYNKNDENNRLQAILNGDNKKGKNKYEKIEIIKQIDLDIITENYLSNKSSVKKSNKNYIYFH